MIVFPQASALTGASPFSVEEVLLGTRADPDRQDDAGRIRVEVDGLAECLCFYGVAAGPRDVVPLIHLDGDCSQRVDGVWTVFESYRGKSPYTLQCWAEQVASAIGRPFVTLGRPGVYGSSGNHQHRRRPREVATVDAALDVLKHALGRPALDLVGFSGGGHLIAALMARRGDIGRAVIASGNVSVDQRNRERGWAADVTGFTDFVDPITLVGEVARHPPDHVVVLTDPLDQVVSGACQSAYVDALRATGVAVDHRLLPALDARRHDLAGAALLAAAALLPDRRSVAGRL